MKPIDESVVVHRATSQNGYQRDYNSMEPFQTCSQIRVITLRRKALNVPLGFSIRGGWEHGTGVFVSEVQPGSISQRQGLKVGDQIMRINGFSIHRAIHMEVLNLLKTCPGVILKVKRVGVLPVKERRKDPVTWKVVDAHSVHTQQSLDGSRLTEYIPESCVVVKIEFSVLGSTSLGCSIARGPPELPGIFMCTVKEGGVADEAGLEVGDQIMEMNGTSFFDIKLADAVGLMKSSKDIQLTVKKRAGISLFVEEKTVVRDPPPPLLLSDCNKNSIISSTATQRRQHSTLLKDNDFSGSSSSKSEEDSSFRSSDSEKDYSISEESGIHSLKPNQGGHHTNGRHKKSASLATTVSGGSSSDDTTCRMDDRWILEEKRKLQDEQRKLVIEKHRLEEERKRLKQLEKSSSSCASSSSSDDSPNNRGGGFLEELQKKAAKMSVKEDRASIDQLILERRNGERSNTLKRDFGKGKGGEEDFIKRRQHEMLMEEFRLAHRKMFGQNNNSTETEGKVTEKLHEPLVKSASNSSAKTCPPVPIRANHKTKITVNGQNPTSHSQTLPRPERSLTVRPRQQISVDDMNGSSKPGFNTSTPQINFRVTFETKNSMENRLNNNNKSSLVEVTPWNTRL